MSAMTIVIVAGALFGFIDLVGGQFKKPGALTRHELGINIFSFVNFLAIRALIVTCWAWLFMEIFPGAKYFLHGFGFWQVSITFFLMEEYVDYWVHRCAHIFPWLWRLHKTHHTPQHLNIGVTYRENWLWFIVNPNIHLSALLVLGGYPEIAAILVMWKGPSAFMVHTATRWDLPLYRCRLTRSIMYVLERVVILPDTHHAHHGVGRYGSATCNFGSFLIIFDLLHGTAEIPRHEQDRFGLPKSVKLEPWHTELWWPLGKSKASFEVPPLEKRKMDAIRTFGDGHFRITM